jgi:hypothetical protein
MQEYFGNQQVEPEAPQKEKPQLFAGTLVVNHRGHLYMLESGDVHCGEARRDGSILTFYKATLLRGDGKGHAGPHFILDSLKPLRVVGHIDELVDYLAAKTDITTKPTSKKPSIAANPAVLEDPS